MGTSVEDPLERLRAGNERFMRDVALSGRTDSKRIWSLAAAQRPFACVMACSDSRVPVEFIFDQGLGDLFVVRTIGNTPGDHEIASVSYAVGMLGVPLVVVMGHTGCGVVRAALEGQAHRAPDGRGATTRIGREVATLLGEVWAAHPVGRSDGTRVPEEEVDRVGREHAVDSARSLVSSCETIASCVREGRCRVISAMYETGVGRVSFLDEVESR